MNANKGFPYPRQTDEVKYSILQDVHEEITHELASVLGNYNGWDFRTAEEGAGYSYNISYKNRWDLKGITLDVSTARMNSTDPQKSSVKYMVSTTIGQNGNVGKEEYQSPLKAVYAVGELLGNSVARKDIEETIDTV